jgi:ubiquinone/menaquinone biosynthesis C-methylase UbiE
MNSSAQEHINQLICGYWKSQCLYVAAKLGIADLLANGPLSVGQLAERTGMHAPSLYRVLRALASLGVFSEERAKRFRLTPAAEILRSDVSGSKRALAIMMGEEYFRAWGELLYSVRTGTPAFDKVFGQPLFDFLAQHPEQAEIFDRAMVGAHGREAADLLDAHDFSVYSSVADIGGGNGSTLCAILERHTNLQGTLFDLPGVVKRARAKVEHAGLSRRMHLVEGDFFQTAPVGADAYLLRHIIHDWNDEQATRILHNIRKAIKRRGRLLIVETVIRPDNEPCFGKLLDLTMLVAPGGKERTEEEYGTLLARTGYRLERIVPTLAEDSVIEGVPE